jgi:hypothetical protein
MSMDGANVITLLDEREIGWVVVYRITIHVMNLEAVSQSLAQPFFCAFGMRFEPGFVVTL